MNWINEAYGELYSVAMGNNARQAPQTEWEIEQNLGMPRRHNRAAAITRFAATVRSRLATALQQAATAFRRPPSVQPGTFSHLSDGRRR